MRDAAAAVVAGHRELVEAEIAHHDHLVARHGALGVPLVPGAARGLAAVPVAAEVGEDYRVVFGEGGSDVMPHDVGLRIAVQQQDRAAARLAAGERVNPYAVRCQGPALEQAGQRNRHGNLIPAANLT